MQISKKAIVVLSFGTTYVDASRSCIETVENRIKEAFLDYDVYRAFTSKMVMKCLAERDQLYVNDLPTVLDRLQADGYSEVIVQTTHLTPGEEYQNKVVAVFEQYKEKFPKLIVGRPLLYFSGDDDKPDDFAIAVQALQGQLPAQRKGLVVVLLGHGSPHQHNPAFERIQESLDKASSNAIVGVVEETDYPNFADVQQALERMGSKEIILMPLLLVAGDHVNHDMAGPAKHSWESRLVALGYKVQTYMHGLGENTAIQNIYVQHVRDAMAGLQ